MAKKKYYSLSKIIETDSTYNIIYGKRSNGKSYAVKHYCMENAINSMEKKFVYLRRYSMDVKAGDVKQYFGDLDLAKLTNGEYTEIEVKEKKINLIYRDVEKNKITRRLNVGYVMHLSGVEHYKSMAYVDVTSVIFEEFVTNEGYLMEETTKLMSIISTVFRNRGGKIFMIGNTVNRICPYFAEWQLTGIPTQEKDTIDIYKVHYDNATIKIAVEYCGDTDTENKFFFGRQADSIIKGNWEVKSYPKPPKETEETSVMARFLLQHTQFSYCINLMQTGDGYVYLKVTPAKKENRGYYAFVISESFSIYPNVVRTLTGTAIGLALKKLHTTGKTTYSDNLTGTEFNNILESWSIW